MLAGLLRQAIGLGGGYVKRWFTLTADRLSYSNTIKDKSPSGAYPLTSLKYLKKISETEFEVRRSRTSRDQSAQERAGSCASKSSHYCGDVALQLSYP